MNKIVFYRFVFILFFLLSYQFSTVHTAKHVLSQLSECDTCTYTKNLDHTLQQSSIPLVLESISLQLEHAEQRTIAKPSVSIKCIVATLKQVDLAGLKYFVVRATPLGYLSTAPPSFFS